jgi:tetratricopeptide (TPR) repeat protein
MSIPRTPLLLCLLLGFSSNLGAETELERATRLIKERHFTEAQALLDRAAQTDPRNADIWYQMGRLHQAHQDDRKAVECADKAIQINPNKADFHVLRGNSLGRLAQKANMFRAMGLAKDGLSALEKAAQLEPGNRTAISALFNWYLNVPSLGGGSQDKAKALAERTQAVDPCASHYFKGQVFQKQSNPGAAQAEYRLAIAADPKYAQVYNAIGYVELGMKQVDMALDHFQKQVELDPENPNSYDSLGDGWMAKGRLEEAIQAYRKALVLEPMFTPSMKSLGKALEQAGRKDEAIQHYRQCAQLGEQKGIPQLASESKKRLKALGVND